MTEAPSCLAMAGRTLWVAMQSSFDIDAPQAELLLLACKQADRAAEAREVLTKEKVVGVDRFGQEKIHPAVQIERMASLACARLVEQISGKIGEGKPAENADEFFQ